MNYDEQAICPRCKKEGSKFFIEKDGHCISCDIQKSNERDKQYDIEQAKGEDGGSSDFGVICPYCGYIEEEDLFEFESGKCDCYKCGKEFDLDIEWTATYKTSKAD